MRKLGITLISILLILSVSASIIGYKYSNKNTINIDNNENNKEKEDNETENNNLANDIIVTNECSYESLPEKYSKELENACKISNNKYINVYLYNDTLKKGEIYDKTFPDYINIDNTFILKNEKISNEEKGNTLILLMNDGILGCYLKSLLLDFYNKEINSSETNIEKFFPNAEVTDNFICLNKKIEKNYIKELTDNDSDLPSVYLLNDKYYILNYDNNTGILGSNENDLINAGFEKIDLEYQDNLETFIKKYDFSEESSKELYKNDIHIKLIIDNGEHKAFKGNNIIELKDNILYLNDKKVNVIDETGNIEKIKKIFIIEEYSCGGGNKFLLLSEAGNIYNFLFDDGTKKVKSNYKFEDVYQVFFKKDIIPEIILKTTDDKLYSVLNKRDFEYVYHYQGEEFDTYIQMDRSIKVNNKLLDYKVKQLYGNYLITTDNKLYSIENNKLVNNSKIKNAYILKDNQDEENYLMYVLFDNNEQEFISDYEYDYKFVCGSFGYEW